MDWKRFDWARGSSSPLEVDLIEHYAGGKISRRDFLRRGTILGLGLPFIATIIAACGDDAVTTTTPAPAGSEATTGTSAPVAAGGSIVIGIQTPSSPLDPVAIFDLGTYSVLSQSFEYLIGVENDGVTLGATGLATGWSSNETGDVWTFNLRQGVKWQDGSDFTSADVAATMDRMVEANNAGLGSVLAAGSTDASDPAVAVITLVSPNGNFPVLVSTFNAQSLITPADYVLGTTLDGRPAGTGRGSSTATWRARASSSLPTPRGGEGACCSMQSSFSSSSPPTRRSLHSRTARSMPSRSSRSSGARDSSTIPTSW